MFKGFGLIGMKLSKSAFVQFVTGTFRQKPEKISPSGPNGDFPGLRYSRFAVGDYSVTSKCLGRKSLDLVQYPG